MSTRTFHFVGAVLLLSLLLPDHAFGGDRPRVLAVPPPSSGLELVEAGTIVRHGGTRKATVSTRTVRVRIGQASPEPRGSLSLVHSETVESRDAATTLAAQLIRAGVEAVIVRR
jgi:hypothetical protein